MNLPCLNKVTTTTTTTTTSTKARKKKANNKERKRGNKQVRKKNRHVLPTETFFRSYMNGHLVDGISTAKRKDDFQSRDLQPR